MVATHEPKTIREIFRETMEQPYLPALLELIRQRTGKAPQRATLSDTVIHERTTSKHWWAVEELARQADAAAYEERIQYLAEQQAGHTDEAL